MAIRAAMATQIPMAIECLISHGGHRTALLVEPDVLEARAIVDAVDHADQILDVRPLAGDAAHIEDIRARILFDQLPLDLPNQLSVLISRDCRSINSSTDSLQ